MAGSDFPNVEYSVRVGEQRMDIRSFKPADQDIVIELPMSRYPYAGMSCRKRIGVRENYFGGCSRSDNEGAADPT